LAFAPDGAVLASASRRDSRIWLWDLSSGRASSTVDHGRSLAALAFSPTTPNTLAWSDVANQVTVWNLSGNRARQLDSIAPACRQPVQLAFSPDGQLLAGTGIGSSTDDFPVYHRPVWGATVWQWREGKGFVQQPVP